MSFVLKAKLKYTNIKALLGNDKVLIRAGKKNEEKIISKLFFQQCFDWFRVHNKKFQLAQQKSFEWFESAEWIYFCIQGHLCLRILGKLLLNFVNVKS